MFAKYIVTRMYNTNHPNIQTNIEAVHINIFKDDQNVVLAVLCVKPEVSLSSLSSSPRGRMCDP